MSNQLVNVCAPVSNKRLVLQFISGLTDMYAILGSQIRHGDSHPPFYKVRFMIILEEMAKAKKATNFINNSACVSSLDDNTTDKWFLYRLY